MNNAHERFWPKGIPKQLQIPETSLYTNLDIAATRFPHKAAIVFYDTVLTYAQLKSEVDSMAAFLQHHCDVSKGDRVILLSQNCPQFIIAFYAVLRADAVVVPINAMCTTVELAHYIDDTGAKVAFAAQELVECIQPYVRSDCLHHLIVHAYGDALNTATTLTVPDWVRERALPVKDLAINKLHLETELDLITTWMDALEIVKGAALKPRAHTVGKNDLCILPYTSGTTGNPKGCMHTHGTIMNANFATQIWRSLSPESVYIAVAPMFHLLGMQNGMNVPLLTGGTIVMLPRWDRDAAADLIHRYRVSVWAAPPAMLVDFFSNPEIEKYDLTSLTALYGGGAAMPEAVAAMLKEKFDIGYCEGYGLTETASFLHGNPLHRLKRQCLGIPTFGVDTRVIDPISLEELPQGEVGELITSGPQVMKGYWNNPQANADAFIEMEGKRFLRTGDLCYVDEDGYFFMRDRLKRMINVSGYKVWPAETESVMYGHPAVHEACVIAAKDKKRGEAVKLLLVLKPGTQASAEEIVLWCRERMAAYKVPQVVKFLDQLPKSGTGKILWRELQESESRMDEQAELLNHS